MRYQVEMVIDVPREQAVTLFYDPDSLSRWQPSLLRAEHMDGTVGEPGARTRLVYKRDNGEMTMIETIEKNDLPDAYIAIYETDGVKNINRNYFHDINGRQTRWVTDSEFQFEGFGMKLMGFFAPFLFKRETRKTMENFKALAEQGRAAA